ncbi:MAG: anthranilate phosphoribosyltransferase [Armatimonadetes bacterium]|jgi:anthranilate phosphoribosyltransferase|nr:anthranilate phosphoribosyltransferase [Armatimonadota bacterium]
MIREAIRKIVEGDHLTEAEAVLSMNEIMDGEATPGQTASFITAMRMKGETVEEITGFVRVMREKAISVSPRSDDLLDTCGTGGDKLGTFNISTTATFVVVGAGVTVAKHGNRAASSSCGSADVLEGLGVNLGLDADRVALCIDKAGLGFMFAPVMHPAMRHAIGPRKEIGIRTVFNLLGPLTNPAGAKRQLVGVFSADLTEPMANVLNGLGTQRAMIVHGMAGLDEISTVGETKISEIKDGNVRTYMLHPSDVGLETADTDQLKVGDGSVMDNVRALLSVLHGEKGPCRDIVLLNAAAALLVADRVCDLREGIEVATKSIDSGAAVASLEAFIWATQELAG